MNLNPIVFKNLHCRFTVYKFNLEFKTNLTMLNSKSGMGKSFVYQAIQNYGLQEYSNKILCLNYININEDLSSKIKKSRGKLIVIDNADLLLTDELKRYIAFDCNNQYLIIGRVLEGLILTRENICSLQYDKHNREFTFKYR